MVSPTAPVAHRPAFARQLEKVASGRAARAAAGARRPVTGSALPSSTRSGSAPWLITRACLLLVAAGVLKLGLIASVGEAAYSERAERLAEGNWAERAAAWVIQPDPVTLGVRGDLAQIAGELSPF